MDFRVTMRMVKFDNRTIERNPDVLLNACKDIGLAGNTGKTKYIEIGCHLCLIAYEDIRLGSNSHAKAKTFKNLDYLVTHQNAIQEEIKYRLKAGINTKKYHVFAPMGRFQLESIYLYFPPPGDRSDFNTHKTC